MRTQDRTQPITKVDMQFEAPAVRIALCTNVRSVRMALLLLRRRNRCAHSRTICDRCDRRPFLSLFRRNALLVLNIFGRLVLVLLWYQSVYMHVDVRVGVRVRAWGGVGVRGVRV